MRWRVVGLGCIVASAAMGLPVAARAGDGVGCLVVAGNGTAGFADGRGADARFHKPIRLAPFGPDAVLVADIFNHALRVVTRGGEVRTLAGAPDRQGHLDGPAATARFNAPHGVGVAPDGRIAVAEAGNHTVRLLTPDPAAAGGFRVTTLAGRPGEKGHRDGEAMDALFNSPHAAVWDEDGALWVPDIGNAAIRRVRDGRVETVAGGSGSGTFVYPMDVAWDSSRGLAVVDAGAHRLLVVTRDGRVTARELQGRLRTPHGVAVDGRGETYVADMGSHRVLAIDGEGRVTTLAGVEGRAGMGDGLLNRPAAVLAHAGWLWVADLDNHRVCVIPLP